MQLKVAFTVRHELSEIDQDNRGWLFGIPNPFPFDIFGGSIFGGYDPFPSGSRYPQPIPSPVVPVVISEVPQTWDDLEELDPELFEPILETRPGRIADPYPGTEAAGTAGPVTGNPYDVSTTPQDDLGEDEVAHDWGHLAREFLGSVGGQLLGQNAATYANTSNLLPGSTEAQLATIAAGGGGGGDCDGMTWAGGAPPKGYKVVRDSCGNGVLRKVRRRRRRRMLTNGDKDDIASIVSMVGKGQMAAALINGSMRRG